MALRFLSLLSLNVPARALMRSGLEQPGMMPGMMPTVGVGADSVGMGPGTDVNIMQELALAYNATVVTFRSADCMAALRNFHRQQGLLVDNISSRIFSRVAQLEEEKRAGGGVGLLAQALLDYEQETRVFGAVAPGLVTETQNALPPKTVVKPEQQLDSGPMMLQLDDMFNSTRAWLQQDALGLNTATAAERCEHIRPVVTKMRHLMWDIARFSHEEERDLAHMDEVEVNPVVMIAPDIIPRYKEFAVNTNLNLVHLTRTFALCIGNVTDFVMANAQKDLGCSLQDTSLARPERQGLGLLTGVVLAAVAALGFAS